LIKDAEVQIDRPNAQYGDEPYTVQLGGCGDPGYYIHLTPNYLMTINSNDNINKYGPTGCFNYVVSSPIIYTEF